MNREKYLGSCAELEKEFPVLIMENCCNSCHVDNEEYGYSLQYIDTDDGFYEVCCKINQAFKSMQNVNSKGQKP